ncbi:hypothetical protein LCGC14_0941610 [marine sediment metagenome]|uniref:Uncharacterized protein n=1 Tax=marine sediment metagenome TaxID=412755 RepID=A0A0F9NJY4_9ZZZZ
MNPNTGRLDVYHNEKILSRCTHVSDGDEVIAPYKGSQGIKCVVIVAAGYHARVVNERYSFDKWFNIQELARLKE